MNLLFRLFFPAAIAVSILLSACERQQNSASQNSQNLNSQDVSSQNQTPAASNSGFVYTADERGNSLSVINLADNQVRKIPVGISPHNIQVSHDGRLLLLVGMPSNGGGGHSHGEESEKHDEAAGGHTDHTGEGRGGAKGKLLIFDAQKLNAADDGAVMAEIEVGNHPAHVVVDPQGKFIYATNSEDDTISVVGAAQKKVVNTIATGKFPHGLRMSPDGREIYTANVNDGTVSVISAEEQKEVARIPVGKAPVQVGFTPDGKRVFVSLRDENAVAVVDTATRKKVASVPVGNQPIQMFSTPDGRFVYVANQGTEDAPDNRVSVIDARSSAVVATITTGKGAHGVVAGGEDGSRVFVTNTFDDTVSVIDAATQKVVSTIAVGDAPNGITFWKAQ